MTLEEMEREFFARVREIAKDGDRMALVFTQLLRSAKAAQRKLYAEYHANGDRPEDEQWAEGESLEDWIEEAENLIGTVEEIEVTRVFETVPYSNIKRERGWWVDAETWELHGVVADALLYALEETPRNRRSVCWPKYRAGREAADEMLRRISSAA